MKARQLLMVLTLFWCLLFLGLERGCERDLGQRTPEILFDMGHSAAFEAQGPNPNFADGRNLRMPVAGTIARGFMPFPYEATPRGAKLAGQELVNPLKASDANIARGERSFKVYCSLCHGAEGKGDGPIVKRGVPPPPSLLLDNARNMKDGEIYHIITRGRNNMPAHASQVDREDRWKIILYLRTLQGVKK